MVHTNQPLFTEQKWYLVSPVAKGQWNTVIQGWQSAGKTAASSATFYKYIYKLHEPVNHNTTLNEQSWDQIDITTTHVDLEPNFGYFVYVSTPGTETDAQAEPETQSEPEPEPYSGPDTQRIGVIEGNTMSIFIMHIKNPNISPETAIANSNHNVFDMRKHQDYLNLGVSNPYFSVQQSSLTDIGDILINDIMTSVNLHHAINGYYPNITPVVKIYFKDTTTGSIGSNGGFSVTGPISELDLGLNLANGNYRTLQYYSGDTGYSSTFTNFSTESFSQDFYYLALNNYIEAEPEAEPVQLDPTNLAYTTFTHNNNTVHTIDIVGEITSLSFLGIIETSDIKSIRIGTNVTGIAQYSLRDIPNLESVTIPDTVTYIGQTAFYQCSSLQTVTIPNSVTVIGNNIFGVCTSLHTVTIGSGINNIPNTAFYQCTALQSIIIPDNITSFQNDIIHYPLILILIHFYNLV